MTEFEVNGKQVEYVEIADMILDELETVTNMSDKTPVDAELALQQADVATWKAVLFVSARRVMPRFDVAELGKLKLFDVIEQVLAASEDEDEDEEAADVPPAGAADEPE